MNNNFQSSSSELFPRNIPDVKSIIKNSNVLNKNENLNQQNSSENRENYFSSQIPKGRKLLEDFDKTENSKNQNNSTAYKKLEQNALTNVPINLNYIGCNSNEKEKINEKKNKFLENNKNKFFIELGLGYKCSCRKTQCNRYYCECYREGRYCLNCNCNNCLNKPPKNCFSNKHPEKNDIESLNNNLICCTCTKSGCNKKYCECYKNGAKCNANCRCIGCENINLEEKIKKEKMQIRDYECCLANSVFIINNKLYEEKILGQKVKRNGNLDKNKKREGIKLCNKQCKNMEKHEENYCTAEKSEDKEKNNSIESDDLFDKKGRIILKNFVL